MKCPHCKKKLEYLCGYIHMPVDITVDKEGVPKVSWSGSTDNDVEEVYCPHCLEVIANGLYEALLVVE